MAVGAAEAVVSDKSAQASEALGARIEANFRRLICQSHAGFHLHSLNFLGSRPRHGCRRAGCCETSPLRLWTKWLPTHRFLNLISLWHAK